ncbi:MAG: hypothetical protein ABIS06_10155 [Vicinamibacterales bacterium]
MLTIKAASGSPAPLVAPIRAAVRAIDSTVPVYSVEQLANLGAKVEPMDPVSFAASVGVLLAVSLVAHLIPLSRALRVDPATALRAQ